MQSVKFSDGYKGQITRKRCCYRFVDAEIEHAYHTYFCESIVLPYLRIASYATLLLCLP